MANKNRANLRSSMLSSLEKEDSALVDRFEKAEKIFNSDELKNQPLKETTLVEKVKAKPKKLVIRKTFTMLEGDLELIDAIKIRAAKKGSITNRSEILRAAICHLNSQNDNDLLNCLANVEKLPVGRPIEKV